MELAVELPSPPQFLPVPQEVYFKPIPFGQTPPSAPTASSLSRSEDWADSEVQGFVSGESSSRASLSSSTISPENTARPAAARPPIEPPAAGALAVPFSNAQSTAAGTAVGREPSSSSVSGTLSSPTKRIEKPKAQLPALKKFKEERVLVRYASANALIPKGPPLPMTSAHYLSILRDTSKRMATQREWNVDEPARKLEKMSLNSNDQPSPREQMEDALGTDKTESEIEQALSSRGPLPEQLLSSRRRARAPDPMSMLRGETDQPPGGVAQSSPAPVPAVAAASTVPVAATVKSSTSGSGPLVLPSLTTVATSVPVPEAPRSRAQLSVSAVESSSSRASSTSSGMPEVPWLRLEKLTSAPGGPLSRLSSDGSSQLSPDRSKYIVNLVSPRTAFAPIRKPACSQLAQGTTARELNPPSPVTSPSASNPTSAPAVAVPAAPVARPSAPLPRP